MSAKLLSFCPQIQTGFFQNFSQFMLQNLTKMYVNKLDQKKKDLILNDPARF
jgi:hypothetical protein